MNVRRLKRRFSSWWTKKEEVEDHQLHRGRGHMFGEGMVSSDRWSGDVCDQTGKCYWQHIEDKFFKFMPRVASPVTRTYRSLHGRWDAIKKNCSWWSRALEQVRNAPPSGATIDDYVSKLCEMHFVDCVRCIFDCVRCIFDCVRCIFDCVRCILLIVWNVHS
jgi:hypothetical protein